MMQPHDAFRRLPQVGALLETAALQALALRHGRGPVGAAARSALERARRAIVAGADAPEQAAWPALVQAELERRSAPRLRPVLNATGVVLHTNLGRSRLAPAAAEAARQAGLNYSNLEYDLEAGQRGERHALVSELLVELSGGQDAFAVNNNAGAVLLALAALAAGRKVIVSRGQLVEIGGSFRIPDVLAASGAQMVEVGTTNKTHLRDFRAAVDEQTALLLRVHPSNYRVVGFTAEVSRAELVGLGRELGLPVVEDLGSGCLVDLSAHGLGEEPTARQVLSDGVDLVTFSGDKLLGGPQAGVIAGRSDLVKRCKLHPLARALRLDKLSLAALEATLRLSLDQQQALERVPTLRSLTLPAAELRRRAEGLAELLAGPLAGLAEVTLEPDSSPAGGGALPLIELPTTVVCLAQSALAPDELARRLRLGDPPLIGRISRDRLLLDPRTLEPDELAAAATALIAALRPEG